MATRFNVTGLDHTCSTKVDHGTSGGAGGSVVIRAAVGAGSPPRVSNRPDDVRAIQDALNRFSPLEGGPITKLKVDGLCGPNTRAAIRRFQEEWGLRPKGWKVVDGIVDVEGPTIERLRKGAGTIANLPAEFARQIPNVMRILTTTRTALAAARFHLRLGGGGSPITTISDLAAEKLDKHFHVRQLRSPVSRLDEVDRVYLAMQTAIGHIPQGVILALPKPPSFAMTAYMFAAPGGYHRPRGRDALLEGLHPGSIYMCPPARTLTSDGFAHVMIHELAHYIGPTGAQPTSQEPVSRGITDHAYFHKGGGTAYARLSADQAFRNADSYAQFAFEAIGKPDFNVRVGRS